MIISAKRASRIASSTPKDNDFQNFIFQNELKYPPWTSWGHLIDIVVSLPENVLWHVVLCVLTLLAILILSMDFQSSVNVFGLSICEALDIAYNALYGLHVFAYLLNDCYRLHHEKQEISRYYWTWYLLDAVTYIHYMVPLLPEHEIDDFTYAFTLSCYYVRLRRPLKYLWTVNDYHLKNTIAGTLLKHLYIFMVFRVLYTNLFIWLGKAWELNYPNAPHWMKEKRARVFFYTFYRIDKLFLPIGVHNPPTSDLGTLLLIMVTISGTLMVYGVACAALAITNSLYMRPKEIFRQRVRLIVNDLKDIHVPPSARKKVKTYYKMYWTKQKAVSKTELLPTYPPSLINTLNTDIYFEAFQKSQILCDLSYQFLSEIAKHMRTINYSPGDVMLSRNSSKFSIFFIADGEVEVLTAEDDLTPILRFTRGSILNPCGGCVEVASSNSHVSVRAATFCVAHVLRAIDLWRVAAVYGRTNGQSYIIHASFHDHFERVMSHYVNRPSQKVKYKSSILILKRNLLELKMAKDEDGNPIMDRTDAFLQIANCYIMKNQPDASKMDEADVICLKSTFPCILQPSSSLQTAWKLFVTVIALTAAFVHPYYIIFARTRTVSFKFFDAIVTIVNIVDIIVHLSTPVLLEDGVPINFLHTASSQLRTGVGWFLCDVLSALPVFYFVANGACAGMHIVFKLPTIFRTLNQMEDECVNHSNLLRFFNYCLLMCVMLCWMVASNHQGYLCFRFKYCSVGSLVKEPYWSVERNAKTSDSILFNMYWAVSFATLTVHLTDKLSSQSWTMQALLILALETCAMLQVVVQSTYAAIFMVINTMRNDYNACIDSVKQFLETNDVHPVLRYRFINYLKLCWYIDKAYSITHENRSILFDLPQHVHQDITALQLNKYLLCIPFMSALPRHVLKAIPAQARLFFTSPNEILLNTGDICNEVYVIIKGFCEVWDPETKKVVSIITTKSHFGDIECFLRVPVYYTVRAVTHVQIFSVSRKYLMKAIALPHIREVISDAKSQPEYHQLIKSSFKQFLKYEMPPPPPNREIFPLLRKHEPDVAFLLPFQRLGFFSISRYIFPRFTIRPDGDYLRRYEWFRAFCAFLSAFTSSFCLLTMQYPWIYYVSIILDLTAYYDVLQRMLVGYYDDKGILIYHPASTASHYIRSAFIFDMLACLPLEHLDSIQLHAKENKKFKIMPATMEFLMFNRCLQMYRVPSALSFLDHFIKRREIVFVFKAIPMFLVLLNMMGTFCIAYSVIKLQYTAGGWKIINLASKYPSWIETDGKYVGYNITKTPFNLWLTTYYWATYQLSTTGFNLFKPSCQELLTIFIFGMLLSMIMTKYVSVRVLSIRSNVNQALADFQENMKDIVTFMNRERFHKDLREEVLEYYKYTWKKTGGINYRSLFKLCNQITLRTDAILHIYGKTFHECPILYHCDLSLLRLLGRAVHSVYFCPDTTIIERGDVISEMYFIDYGIIAARDKEDDDHTVADLPCGSVLGNLNNVSRMVCPNRFVTRSNVHLLKIDAKLFYKILQDFPTIRTRIIQLRPHKENYIKGNHSSMSMEFQTHWVVTAMIMKAAKSRVLKYLHTHSDITLIYLTIVCLLCVFLDVFNAGFQNNHKSLIRLLYALDVLFIPKILLNLLIPYIKESNRSLATVRATRRKYLLGELKYDVISLLPVELFCFLFANRWKALSLLRLNRFFRMVTVHSCLTKYLRKSTINLLCVSGIAMSIWFCLLVHSITCLWHIIGVTIDEQQPRTSWRWNYTNQYVCFKNRYICSCYFILITLTQNAVGGVLPRRQIEVAFVCVLMILSIIVGMLYVGEFANIILYQFNRCYTFYSKYLELKQFLKNNRVADNLVTLTNQYTLHLWREARGLQIPHFVNTAPQCLRLKIMSAAYMKHLLLIPAFKHCEPEFLRQLVGHFQPFYYDKKMNVVREGEITNSMYFIHKGCVQEIVEDPEEETQVFNEKTNFGTIQGLFRDVPFTHSYKTKIRSQVLTLSLDNWVYLLKYFPNNKKIISKYYAGPGVMDKVPSMIASKIRSSYSNADKTKLKSEMPQKQDTTMPLMNDDMNTSVKAKPPNEKPTATDELQSFTSLWPLDSRKQSSYVIPFEDKDGDNAPTIVRTHKSTLLGIDTENADMELSSFKMSESPTNPIVIDLTKSASSKASSEIEETSIELQSLLPPPEERSNAPDAIASENLQPSKDMLQVATAEIFEDKTMPKNIRKTSKSSDLITRIFHPESSILKHRSLSVALHDDPYKRVKISSIDPKTTGKPKHSALSFSEKIATFEDSSSEKSESSETVKKAQDVEAEPKDVLETTNIAAAASSMSLQSFGDVETYIMDQKRDEKNKRNSKENRKEKKK